MSQTLSVRKVTARGAAAAPQAAVWAVSSAIRMETAEDATQVSTTLVQADVFLGKSMEKNVTLAQNASPVSAAARPAVVRIV